MGLESILSKEFLTKAYVADNKSAEQIASMVNCCSKSVYEYLEKHKIPRRTPAEFAKNINYSHGNWSGNNVRDILTEDFLRREYVILNKSVHQIAKENNISSSNSVGQYLRKFGIYRSGKHNSGNVYTKEFLEEYYVKQNMSLLQVAKIAGKKSKAVVKRWLIYHEIPIRDITISEAIKRSRTGKRGKFFSSKYWSGILSGARQRNIQMCITKEFAYDLFIKQDSKCAISGVDIYLLWDTDVRTASLDRINSLGHYTEDNVQWIHRDVNQMKMDMTDTELINWCKVIAEFNKGTDVTNLS